MTFDTSPINVVKQTKIFARNVASMRAYNSLTASAFARTIGICRATVTAIEYAVNRPEVYSPHVETVSKFASAAGVSVSDIMTKKLKWS